MNDPLALLREAAHHPHKGPNDTDASMLREAAERAEGGYVVGGQHTQAMTGRVLRTVADMLERQSPIDSASRAEPIDSVLVARLRALCECDNPDQPSKLPPDEPSRLCVLAVLDQAGPSVGPITLPDLDPSTGQPWDFGRLCSIAIHLLQTGHHYASNIIHAVARAVDARPADGRAIDRPDCGSSAPHAQFNARLVQCGHATDDDGGCRATWDLARAAAQSPTSGSVPVPEGAGTPETGAGPLSPLAGLLANYLAVRQLTLSTAHLTGMQQMLAEAKYVRGEAQELLDAVQEMADAHEHGEATSEHLTAIRKEVADVALADATFASLMPGSVTVELCIAEKTEADRGRG